MTKNFGENVGNKIVGAQHDTVVQDANLALEETIRLNEQKADRIAKEFAELSLLAQQNAAASSGEVQEKMSELIHEFLRLAGPEKARLLREANPELPPDSEGWRRILGQRDDWFPGTYVRNERGEFEMQSDEE